MLFSSALCALPAHGPCLRDINARQAAVAELVGSHEICVTEVKEGLTTLPDLERGLCSVYYGRVRFSRDGRAVLLPSPRTYLRLGASMGILLLSTHG